MELGAFLDQSFHSSIFSINSDWKHFIDNLWINEDVLIPSRVLDFSFLPKDSNEDEKRSNDTLIDANAETRITQTQPKITNGKRK